MTGARRVLVALILAATATFVVGVLLERHQAGAEGVETSARRSAETDRAGRTDASSATRPRTESSQKGESGERRHSGEAGESGGERRRETAEATTPTAGRAPGEPARPEPPAHAESSEELLGIDPESSGLLGVAVVVSLLSAAAVVGWAGRPIVLGIVALAMAGFCALDIREVAHQLTESRTALAILAAVVAALHLAAAALAARVALATRDTTPPPAAA